MTTKSEIQALNFYGAQTTIAPILQTGRGRDAALRAARRDEKRLYRIFGTQEASFKFADSKPHLSLRVWAYEIDRKGRRKFVVASYESFWRWYRRCIRRGSILHFYEIIRRGYASRLYFDLEYMCEYNSNVKGEDLITKLKQVVKEMKECEHLNRDCIILDSTTEKKWSKHVIFPNIVFYDNEQVGEFVEKVAKRMGDDVFVKNGDGSSVPFIDLAVYSKNRCFRLIASSKYGKSTRLLVEGQSQNERLSVSEVIFFESLVCNVSSNRKLIGSPRTFREPSYRRHNNYSVRNRNNSNDNQAEQQTEHNLIDKYVLSIVEPHGGAIYGVTSMRGALSYAIKGGYKYCNRIKRNHISNNVILIADLVTRSMFQKCFDPDCANYCSEPWDIPEWVFPKHPDEDGLSDTALIAMMNKLDQSILQEKQQQSRNEHTNEPRIEETQLTDDLLNAVMDCVEAELYGGGVGRGEMETGTVAELNGQGSTGLYANREGNR